MTKTEYAEELKGDRWQEMRKTVLSEQTECARCSMPRWLAAIAYDQDLHCHHKTYKNKGTDKEIDDLEALCRRCHEIETFGRSDLKAPKNATCQLCDSVHFNVFSNYCSDCETLIVLRPATFFKLGYLESPGKPGFPIWGEVMYAGLCIYAGCKGHDEAINMALSIVGHAYEVFTKDKATKDEDIPF